VLKFTEHKNNFTFKEDIYSSISKYDQQDVQNSATEIVKVSCKKSELTSSDNGQRPGLYLCDESTVVKHVRGSFTL
jgi:hypothetical protein